MFGKSADALAILILVAIFGLLMLAYLIHWLTHRSDYTLHTKNSQPNPMADVPHEFQNWLRSNNRHLPREISDWLTENNYILRAVEQKGYRGTSGPFIGKMSVPQLAYRVVISEQGSEKRRVAWIRIGEDIWHTTDQMTVIWDDEWRPQEKPINER